MSSVLAPIRPAGERQGYYYNAMGAHGFLATPTAHKHSKSSAEQN
jgi:hypothetical protein